jgi:hypothetical protein
VSALLLAAIASALHIDVGSVVVVASGQGERFAAIVRHLQSVSR